MLWSK